MTDTKKLIECVAAGLREINGQQQPVALLASLQMPDDPELPVEICGLPVYHCAIIPRWDAEVLVFPIFTEKANGFVQRAYASAYLFKKLELEATK